MNTLRRVAAEYLQFRRTYYHGSSRASRQRRCEYRGPQSRGRILAENTLKVLPNAVKTRPVISGIIEHLQQVADLNSISEAERSTLHNMTMAFLYGMKDGVQPWYVAMDPGFCPASHQSGIQAISCPTHGTNASIRRRTHWRNLSWPYATAMSPASSRRCGDRRASDHRARRSGRGTV